MSQFEFCRNLSFVTIWVLSHFEFLSFVTIWVLSHFEFCYNLSFWVLSPFEILSFVTILVILFCHHLSFRVSSQGTPDYIHCSFKNNAFTFRKRFLKYFFTGRFLFGANLQNSFWIHHLKKIHKHKKIRRPLLYQLFTKAVHISTVLTQTKWSWALWLTNDKASYVAKEDSICLFSVCQRSNLERTMDKTWCPFEFLSFITIWVFEFLSQFEFLSFITIWVFRSHHNLSFWVSSQFELF